MKQVLYIIETSQYTWLYAPVIYLWPHCTQKWALQFSVSAGSSFRFVWFGFYILRLTMGGIIRFPGPWIYPCNNRHCSNHSILSYCGDSRGRMLWWPHRNWYRLHSLLHSNYFLFEWGSQILTSPLNDRLSGSDVSLILSYWSTPSLIDPLVPISTATELV